MLQVFKFILECCAEFIAMLFTIDIGDGLSLGLIMCVVFIFLPCVLIIVNFLKVIVIDEFDERYDTKKNFGLGKFSFYKPKHAKKEYEPKHAKKSRWWN